MRSVLIAVAAFAAGVLVGHLATPDAALPARTRPPDTARPEPAARGEAFEPPAAPPVGSPGSASGPVVEHPPDEDRPLDPGTDFGAWDDDEFVRWYAVHRRAWDLPDLDEAEIRRRASAVLALGRIPRRDVLLVLFDAFGERDREVEEIVEEQEAWFAANPPAPRKLGDPDPTLLAYRQRIAAVEQRCFDRLHRELAYSDYLLLHERSGEETERRPPPGGPLPGGDPYARPVDTARKFYGFSAWYRAYGPELGLPERDEDFLAWFHQHVVLPLGRLPEPALMLTLEEAYLPFYPRLREGSDWDATVRGFFARLDKVLVPLDYQRMRHSHEWAKTCRALAVPEATYFAAGR